MRVILLTTSEANALNEIKRFFVNECMIPNSEILADNLGIHPRSAGYLMTQLNDLGLIKRNRCNGWRFSRIPYQIEVRG